MKHQQAPMLREREQYLSKLHSRGLSLKYIKDTECDLLRLIKALDLCDDSKRSISVEEIRDTVSRIRNCPVSKMHDYGSRGDAGFVSMLILCFSWLDDIGLLDNRYSKTSLLGHLFPNACPRVRIALYPLLDSRISYLEKCKSLLICDRTLKEIALYQLRIIELLGIESGKWWTLKNCQMLHLNGQTCPRDRGTEFTPMIAAMQNSSGWRKTGCLTWASISRMRLNIRIRKK